MTEDRMSDGKKGRQLQRTDGASGFLPAHRLIRSEGRAAHPVGRLFLLHGFFGSGRNWSAIGRGVVRGRPDWEVVLVDLRLHGESQEAPPPHTVRSCASDVARLSAVLADSGGPSALLGHSFGGKVAMMASDAMREPCVQGWVVDSTPSAGATAAGARRMLDLLTEIPGPFDSRREGADAVERGGFPRFIGEWMATNLVRGPEGFSWRFDMGEMRSLLVDFYLTDAWKQVESPPEGFEFRFVRATRNSILTDGDADRIERLENDGARVRLDTLEGGHWLNVDNPDGLIGLIRKGLPRV